MLSSCEQSVIKLPSGGAGWVLCLSLHTVCRASADIPHSHGTCFIHEMCSDNIHSLVCCVSFQYVVTPRRQSTAIALQILVSHLLGDAGSPYLVGMVSEFPAYLGFL